MAADITQLNQNVVAISSQLTKSPHISSPRNRPAELACEAIENELRSIGVTEFTGMLSYYLKLYASTTVFECMGTLIDKRFVITTTNCLRNHTVTKLSIEYSFHKWMAPSVVKKTHIQHAGSPNSIALIELESDVEYSSKLCPTCLYTKQFKPKNYLTGRYITTQIVPSPECRNTTCAKESYSFCFEFGYPVFEVMEFAPAHRLFGIAAEESCTGTYGIMKVFDHLDYIESIVWPKSGT